MSLSRALLVVLSVPLLLAPLSGCKEDLASIVDPPCENCGVVESIVTREVQGQAGGGGAVAGAIVGGVIGHQIGSGSGNKAATVAGAAGGAIAGNEIEKDLKKHLVYEVTVRMEKDGLRRMVVFDTPPEFREGDKVEVTGDRVERV